MKEFKAPQRYFIGEEDRVVFLAGSIEMGKADNWQTRIVKALKGKNGIILNPRRDDWDSSWVQEIDNPKFREQVEWELKAMEDAHIIAMMFDPATKSPITLLELGLWTVMYGGNQKLLVCCPKGYWRKGNVDIVCRKYKIPMVVSEQDLILTIKHKI